MFGESQEEATVDEVRSSTQFCGQGNFAEVAITFRNDFRPSLTSSKRLVHLAKCCLSPTSTDIILNSETKQEKVVPRLMRHSTKA